MRPGPLALALSLSVSATLAACQGCKGAPSGDARGPSAGDAGPPTLRLYLMSTVAGALEPCGCSKDQLGGVDKLGALLAAESKRAPASAVAAAGPLFFLEPKPRAEQSTQDTWKAEALADAWKQLGLAAFSPGYNDWVGGDEALRKLAARSGAALVGANLAGASGVEVRELGGQKVGFIGLTTPELRGAAPSGVTVTPPADRLAGAVAEAKQRGATILVGLFTMNRGLALRLTEAAPELAVVAVGKPFAEGDLNDKPAPPALIGQTLVVETANHLQTVAAVDLYVRGGPPFQDGAGLARAAERLALSRRIDELTGKLRGWELNKTIPEADLAARRDELRKLERELAALSTPPAPQSGSYFRYQMLDVKGGLGEAPALQASMQGYYRRVNDHNRAAFAGRRAPKVPDGESGYLGAAACGVCHPGALEVWKKTPHARAYATLSAQAKEFNLDCVSCHVTGYERPGGSTVTDNASLQDVQCEACHGPGARHKEAPSDRSRITRQPRPESCVDGCHHPPHVEGFDPAAKMRLVLGPGHGDPGKWPAPTTK
ncbi:MAG: hypothetical protein IT374_10935 [Polyangiaceae bacterium]|nr:hypothetical protein [Polyangiaceae bacterium]